MPAVTGNGLAMRAGSVLRALAERYHVSLLVVGLYPGSATLAEALRPSCDAIAVVAPNTDDPQPYAGRTFDVLHVFRLAALPFARPYLANAARWHLDLDDFESQTHTRIARLAREEGLDALADEEEMWAAESAQLEAEVLHDFDRVYVCSEVDRVALAGRGRAEVIVWANTAPLPGPLPPPPRVGPFTFLFVGTLGYFPNSDAVWWWCTDVLPLLRSVTPAPFRLLVVGTGDVDALADLEELPEVEIVGAVPDLTPWYERAHTVIVPIRAGGGTRIKILEAFSYRRPVVSTTIGAEGLPVRANEHLLIGDTAAEFAAQCARLIDDAPLRTRLTEAALEMLPHATRPPLDA